MKSIAPRRRTSGGRWHSCATCRSTILFVLQKRRAAVSFALSLFLRKAVLTSHAFRVNNCTDTMKPCSQSLKNHINNCSSTGARTDCLPTCSKRRCAASGFDMLSCFAGRQRRTCKGWTTRSRQQDLDDSPASWRTSMMPRRMSFLCH